MFCPVCKTQYAFFEKKCTRCDVDLVEGEAPEDGPGPIMFAASRDDDDQSPASSGRPEVKLVSIFKTSDPGVLPLATMALDAEGIDYFVKHAGKADSMQWAMSQEPTSRAVVVEILVGSDVETKARDLVADLEHGGAASPVSDTALAAAMAAADPPTVALEDAVSGKAIGRITESQLQEITSRLEEEAPQQYFITGATVDMLQEAGVDASLIQLLRDAVGADGSGLVIRWLVR